MYDSRLSFCISEVMDCRRPTWLKLFCGVLSVSERQEFNYIFESRFEEFYARVFRHSFCYETLQLEDSAREQQVCLADTRSLQRVLNRLSFYPRRAFRRRNTGKTLPSANWSLGRGV